MLIGILKFQFNNEVVPKVINYTGAVTVTSYFPDPQHTVQPMLPIGIQSRLKWTGSGNILDFFALDFFKFKKLNQIRNSRSLGTGTGTKQGGLKRPTVQNEMFKINLWIFTTFNIFYSGAGAD